MHKWVFAAILFSMLSLAAEVNAQGIGTSSIVLNQSSISLNPGASAKVGYTVQLVSGSAWGTTISASNAAALQGSGITLSFSNSYSDPTYSGVLTVSAAASATAGTHTAQIEATGDDPTTAPASLTILVSSPTSTQTTTTTAVANKTASSTTIASTTTVLTTTVPSTTAPTTTAYSAPPSASGATYAVVAIVVVVVIAAIAYFLLRRR